MFAIAIANPDTGTLSEAKLPTKKLPIPVNESPCVNALIQIKSLLS